MKIFITTNLNYLSKRDLREFTEIIPGVTIKVKKTKDKFRAKYLEKFQEVHGDFDWIRSITPAGYDVRGFITSKHELIANGIKNHIGLYDNFDADNTMDFYSGLATTLDKRAILNGFKSNLAWQLAHETGHGLGQMTGKPEILHLVHDAEAKGELKALLVSLHQDYLKKIENMKTQVSLLQRVLELLTKLKSIRL